MAQRTLSVPHYVIICGVLILLTCLTVGLSFAGLGAGWHVVVGLTIALCKATLVAAFFMHVVHSPRLTLLVVIVSCFWLSILIVLTLTDYFSRGLMPFMPGH